MKMHNQIKYTIGLRSYHSVLNLSVTCFRMYCTVKLSSLPRFKINLKHRFENQPSVREVI